MQPKERKVADLIKEFKEQYVLHSLGPSLVLIRDANPYLSTLAPSQRLLESRVNPSNRITFNRETSVNGEISFNGDLPVYSGLQKLQYKLLHGLYR